MQHSKNILLLIFVTSIVAVILMAVLFENNILTKGLLEEQTNTEFFSSVVMDLATPLLIVTALRLFSFKSIKTKLTANPEKELMKWGVLRIMMLALPLLLNTSFYYLFSNTSFGYLAIILLISMIFVLPTQSKCYYETKQKDMNKQP